MVAMWLMLLSIIIVVSYTGFYLRYKAGKPRLYHGKGAFPRHLRAHCPSLRETYWPTWWAFNRHVITVGRVFLQSRPNLVYKRSPFWSFSNTLNLQLQRDIFNSWWRAISIGLVWSCISLYPRWFSYTANTTRPYLYDWHIALVYLIFLHCSF